jgi:Protein of unknown function (DUF3071)
MRELHLVALDADGTALVLRSERGDEYAVAVDERLRAALRNDRARLGQLEIELESQLRPKDIQARIRAGDTAEDVAAAAGVPVERVRRFAGPVLAERDHAANQARRTAVRRAGQDGPGLILDDIVSDRLEARGVDPAGVRWDAWRRDDGRWTVTASYRAGNRNKTALWVYDPARRVVLADDDEARWITGERPPAPDASLPFVPRLAAVPEEEPPGGEEIDVPDLSVPVPAAAAPPAAATVPADEPEPAARAAAAGGSRGRRATVPSWDEIVFGTRTRD